MSHGGSQAQATGPPRQAEALVAPWASTPSLLLQSLGFRPYLLASSMVCAMVHKNSGVS